jgi:pullulanase/glycogen debranching enzyme
MESIYLRAQEKLEGLDFKNIIKLHRRGITIMMDVVFQLNPFSFNNFLSNYFV